MMWGRTLWVKHHGQEGAQPTSSQGNWLGFVPEQALAVSPHPHILACCQGSFPFHNTKLPMFISISVNSSTVWFIEKLLLSWCIAGGMG